MSETASSNDSTGPGPEDDGQHDGQQYVIIGPDGEGEENEERHISELVE